MRSLREFIVSVNATHRTGMNVGGIDLEITEAAYMREEYTHMNNFGEVVAVPETYKEGVVEVGDTIWFHHNIVINQKNVLGIGDNKNRNQFNIGGGMYAIPYVKEGRDNLVYMAKKKDGSYHTVGDVFFCTPNNDRGATKIGEIEIPRSLNQNIIANVSHTNPFLENKGVYKGSSVCVADDSDYEFKIDGVSYWRMFFSDIEYTVEDNRLNPIGNRVIIKTDENEKKVGVLEIPKSIIKKTNKATIVNAPQDSVHNKGDKVVILKRNLTPLSSDKDNNLFSISSNKLLSSDLLSQLK